MQLAPSRSGTPEAKHCTYLGTAPEKDNVANEITAGILQSHDINIKPTGDLGVLYWQMCFVKMHRPLHGLMRFRRPLRQRLINCPANMPALPKSDRKRLRDQTCLFAFMKSESTDSGTGAGVAPGIANIAAKHGTQARLDETPRPHVLRFLLAPNQSCFLRKSFNRRAQLLLIQRIELFDANNCAVEY